MYGTLRHVRRLQVADEQHKRQVNFWLEPPKATVELIIKPERVAA